MGSERRAGEPGLSVGIGKGVTMKARRFFWEDRRSDQAGFDGLYRPVQRRLGQGRTAVAPGVRAQIGAGEKVRIQPVRNLLGLSGRHHAMGM